MGRISQSSIDEVIEKNDIVDVVSRYTTLKRSGSNMVGKCPFHAERNPSFNVRPERQLFKCFSCGKGGNVIKFIEEAEHLSFRDAVLFLASRSGVTIVEEEGKALKVSTGEIYNVLRDAAMFYIANLKTANAKAARAYLKEREVAPKYWRKFGLGYAGANQDELYCYLKSLGYKDQDILEARVVTNRYGRFCDFMRNRIIFPIINNNRRVIAFGGRNLLAEGPKYLNTSESKLFYKSRNLFNLSEAKKYTGTDKVLILCEGYMDVIAMSIAGIENAVAPLGTAFTPEQAKIMARYADKVVVLFDADAAGEKAAVKAYNILRNVDVKPAFVLLDDGLDPDDYRKKYGAELLQTKIKSATDFELYRLELLKRSYLSANKTDKFSYQDRAIEILTEVLDLAKLDYYEKFVSELFQINSKALSEEVDRRKSLKNGKAPDQNIDRATGESSYAMPSWHQAKAADFVSRTDASWQQNFTTAPKQIDKAANIANKFIKGTAAVEPYMEIRALKCLMLDDGCFDYCLSEKPLAFLIAEIQKLAPEFSFSEKITGSDFAVPECRYIFNVLARFAKDGELQYNKILAYIDNNPESKAQLNADLLQKILLLLNEVNLNETLTEAENLMRKDFARVFKELRLAYVDSFRLGYQDINAKADVRDKANRLNAYLAQMIGIIKGL